MGVETDHAELQIYVFSFGEPRKDVHTRSLFEKTSQQQLFGICLKRYQHACCKATKQPCEESSSGLFDHRKCF
ncbi:hypothetical protein AV530_005275 [Patagioenas fasciata monilis]|uniref:Uncharacterized protein n=1 Tax=Patagioenas fasciata monilis TaxID=372326 RepID=A0A1V4JKP1_PATFA|nr:hypothetical protein AV530_005275 [Patagioenas fasciata monilis]